MKTLSMVFRLIIALFALPVVVPIMVVGAFVTLCLWAIDGGQK